MLKSTIMIFREFLEQTEMIIKGHKDRELLVDFFQGQIEQLQANLHTEEDAKALFIGLNKELKAENKALTEKLEESEYQKATRIGLEGAARKNSEGV